MDNKSKLPEINNVINKKTETYTNIEFISDYNKEIKKPAIEQRMLNMPDYRYYYNKEIKRRAIEQRMLNMPDYRYYYNI